MFNHIKTLGNHIKCKFNIDLPCQDDNDGVTTTTSQSGPVKTFDDLFGGPSTLGPSNGTAGSGIVFNKDSDDESEHGGGGNAVNVEELIRASDDSDGGEAIGIDW